MNKENRIYTRLVFDGPAQCAYLKSFPETFPVTITNINPEGLGFISSERLDVGTDLYILLETERDKTAKLTIKVQWSLSMGNSNRYQTGAKVADVDNVSLEEFILSTVLKKSNS